MYYFMATNISDAENAVHNWVADGILPPGKYNVREHPMKTGYFIAEIQK